MSVFFFFRALQKPDPNNNKLVTGTEAEALSSLSAAIMLQKKGNKEKARKLFRHAMALCPKHPKILNHYGEFLEALEGQILQVSQGQDLGFRELTDAFTFSEPWTIL